MVENTNKEHYVPQFILRNFTNQNGKLFVANIISQPVRYYEASPEGICFQNHLYETKNFDDTFYERNSIEKHFANIESWLSSQIKDIQSKVEYADYSLTGEDDAVLAMMIALQLNRLPVLKLMITSNLSKNEHSEQEHHYLLESLYRMMIYSNKSGINYLRNNGIGISNEDEKRLNMGTILEETASFILSNCVFYMLMSEKDNFKFLISDNPVLIDIFEDAKYIFPISPNIAIACSTFKKAYSKQFEKRVNIKNDIVEKINRYTILNAQRFIMGQGFKDNDKELIEELISAK